MSGKGNVPRSHFRFACVYPVSVCICHIYLISPVHLQDSTSMTWSDPIHQVVLTWPSLQLSKVLLRDLQQFDEGIEGEFSVTWVQILLSPQMQVHRLSCGWLQKSSCDSLQSTCCLSHPFTAVPCCAHLRLWRGSHPPDWPPAVKHDSNLTIQQLRSVLIRFLQVQALSWSMESKTPCTAPPCNTCERLSCTEKGVAKRMNKNEKTDFLSFLIFFKFFSSSFASCTVAA